jgi:hypothetical protein
LQHLILRGIQVLVNLEIVNHEGHEGLFSTAAAVAECFPIDISETKEPVSFIMFHGTADEYVPFHRGKSKRVFLKEPFIVYRGYGGDSGHTPFT